MFSQWLVQYPLRSIIHFHMFCNWPLLFFTFFIPSVFFNYARSPFSLNELVKYKLFIYFSMLIHRICDTRKGVLVESVKIITSFFSVDMVKKWKFAVADIEKLTGCHLVQMLVSKSTYLFVVALFYF